MKLMILGAAISAAALATACGSAASTPRGQPGASLPPSAACLSQGNCTAAQQAQVAAGMGVTNPAGLNGCLVAGDCTASEQQGLAQGTSAGDSSGQLPTSAPAPSSPATTGPGGLPVAQTVKMGQAFTTIGAENNVTATWRVTLDNITCGSGTIFSPQILAADAASMGQRPPATPRADPA